MKISLHFIGQRGLSAKTLQAPTPRKALGDLGNIQHGTAKKFQTPKPSKVKIFDETPKAKTSVKTKKATFSALKTQKGQNKIASDMKIPTKNENMLPDIEKMIPFVDQGKSLVKIKIEEQECIMLVHDVKYFISLPEKDLPRPECITKLLKHRGPLNPAIMVPPTTYQDNFKTPLHYELETFEPPLFGN